MSGSLGLTPEDDLYGRVALHNKLATRRQIEECAEVIAGAVAAGRPRYSLASVLISKGFLSEPAAAALQKAVDDYAAKTAGKAPPAPGLPPERKQLKKAAPRYID